MISVEFILIIDHSRIIVLWSIVRLRLLINIEIAMSHRSRLHRSEMLVL